MHTSTSITSTIVPAAVLSTSMNRCCDTIVPRITIFEKEVSRFFFGFFGKELRNIFRFSDISVKNSLDLDREEL